jgi:hypothetical protein
VDLQILAASADVSDLVRVEAPGLSGWCVWPDAPAAGAVVDVELDVPGEVAWDDVEVDDDDAGGASDPGPTDGLTVRARVSDVDEHGVATLNLSAGGILLVDTVGERPPHVVGRAVTLHLNRVPAHPTAV